MVWHLLSSVWLWTGLIAAGIAWNILMFLFVPRWARWLAARGQTTRAVRLLAWVVRLPSTAASSVKLDARYSLALYLSNERRFADAVVQWQLVLAQNLPAAQAGGPGLEAEARRRLADCLEALGQPQQAQQERERARESLRTAKTPSPMSLLSQGKLFKDQGNFAEAYNAFERGLALIKPAAKPQQVKFMTQLMLVAYNNGRPDLTVHWAERAIANGASGVVAKVCYKMAGIGYGDQGSLERAEQCYQDALAVAQDAKAEKEVRVLLAALLRKQGKLTEAMQECQAVLQTGPTQSRAEYTTLAECLRDLGRFDEALDAMRQACDAPGFAVPSAERRIQAAFALGMAWIASTAERPAEALEFLRGAAAELAHEEKLGVWIAATGARIHAQLKQRQDSEALAEAVRRALPKYAEDKATLKLAYSGLARAAFALGDWTRSQNEWALYFAQQPFPIEMPVGHYYLGECALALGDSDAARAAFKQAQSVNPDLYYAHLARRRLDEMDT